MKRYQEGLSLSKLAGRIVTQINHDPSHHYRRCCKVRHPYMSELYLLLPAHFDKNDDKWHNIVYSPRESRIECTDGAITRHHPLFKELCPRLGDNPCLKFLQLDEGTSSVILSLPLFGPNPPVRLKFTVHDRNVNMSRTSI